MKGVVDIVRPDRLRPKKSPLRGAIAQLTTRGARKKASEHEDDVRVKFNDRGTMAREARVDEDFKLPVSGEIR